VAVDLGSYDMTERVSQGDTARSTVQYSTVQHSTANICFYLELLAPSVSEP
jgi:hypothetical protein